jgi:3-dehydroquinate synthase
MRTVVHVDLGVMSYPIIVSDKNNYNDLKKHIGNKKILIITNEIVANLYLPFVKNELKIMSRSLSCCILPDGEIYKNHESLNRIHSQLLEENFSRDTLIVALGGGVIGDLSGFAASIYQRGVDIVQLPTTLLSCVDSSVGGKTAINHALGKNMIGTFYQPKCVLIGTDMLISLPEREFNSGLAEVIKYGCIMDEDFFLWLEANINRLKERDFNAVSYAISKSCELKAKIVAMDEQERGGIRALLNFGHTFAHAIEVIEDYKGFKHGEAVAIGMVIAANISYAIGNIELKQQTRIKSLLKTANLPVSLPDFFKSDDLLLAMKRDKKNTGGKLTLVLLERLGKAYLVHNIKLEIILNALADVRF